MATTVLAPNNILPFFPDPDGYPAYSRYTQTVNSGMIERWESHTLSGHISPGLLSWGYEGLGITASPNTPITQVLAIGTLLRVPGASLGDSITYFEVSINGGTSWISIWSGSGIPTTATQYSTDITSAITTAGGLNVFDFSQVIFRLHFDDSLFVLDSPPGLRVFVSNIGLQFNSGEAPPQPPPGGTVSTPWIKVLPVVVTGQYFPGTSGYGQWPVDGGFPTGLQTPTRGPGWSVKKSPEFSTQRSQTTAGKVYTKNDRICPLWNWEFTFEVLMDDPSKQNQYFTVPVPETDLEELQSFYASVQGSGDFAYQPPDYIRGGVFSITSVVVNTNGIAILKSSSPLGSLRLGDKLVGAGFGVATYLNGVGTVVNVNTFTQTITILISTGGTHSLTTDTGTMTGGQPLGTPDANNRVELVNSIGSYSADLSSTTLQVTEPVQMVDPYYLTIYDGTGASVAYTIANGTASGSAIVVDSINNKYYPYLGLVLQFASTPTGPLTAAFNYYYICKFSEDTQDFDNFMAMLYSVSLLKIQQVRY